MSDSFSSVFCDKGGLSECCLLIDACLDTLKHWSSGDGRASHRLTLLLGQAIQVSLLTDSGPIKSQILAALEAVFCSADDPLVTTGHLANQICCTLIECSVIQTKDSTNLQRFTHFGTDDDETVAQEGEHMTVVNDGYDADDESPELIATGLPESKAIGELKHPELCIVAVKHLQQRLQASEESDRALDFATSNVCRL
uniref:Uncharacterized protein n=1 Tax=Plectus sambesii TaxID=2011161 RepID=A0A914V0H1_9BILA